MDVCGTATHDAIVWGSTPEERERRRRDNDPKLQVPITSELGCVTPHIVAGWAFSRSELAEQVLNLVVSMTSNTGCNCNSAKVLVLPRDWPQAGEFLDLLRETLRKTPMAPPYYPGIHARYEAFKKRYPACEAFEGPAVPSSRPLGPHLPFLLHVMEEVPEDPAEEAFNVEPFAPVLTVVSLPTSGPEEFLREAVRFANTRLWGSLSATIVLHPGLEKAHPEAAQKAVDELRYGVVSVNAWAATSFLVGSCTWGAFDGDQTIADVGSGLGVVGNPFLVAGVQKAVYRTPLAGQAIPKPPQAMAIPLVAAKLVLGYVVGGFWGMLRAVWAR
ncbi:hypothetical protein GPECTOR_30g217 [Gonium pectorale]|uniref:Aldehyde dehydrogenase domain-containing protein n=1 Tax=Gonium pectorale TaxID=33097 RepID=A0A150GE38_GONPE|nr:hypothetical protein GPECTOR_30g217 [Gonium pectorale]|eukprot:KXZ48121.1 hypothetical protein GPECTOR_30g217 [Gonium pectorale]